MRLAVSLCHRCQAQLFRQEWLARQLTLFDRWLVVLGPVGTQEPRNDGSAAVLRSVAARYPSRVRLEEHPAGWRSEGEALRAALITLRDELGAEPAYLWRVPPGEAWELAALRHAEQQLREQDATVGQVLVGNHYRTRLWRWVGELPDPRAPWHPYGHGPAVQLAAVPLLPSVS